MRYDRSKSRREETRVNWKKLGRKRKGEEANMVETEGVKGEKMDGVSLDSRISDDELLFTKEVRMIPFLSGSDCR